MNQENANHSLIAVRAHLHEHLGRASIASLHRQNRWLDLGAVLLALSLFGLGTYVLGTAPVSLAWLALFVAQGFVLQWMGLVSHDVFVHRKVWGETGSWLGSLVLTMPRLSLPTGYEQAHLQHHQWIGTDRDTEAYKQHLDTRARRFLFLTIFGIKLAQAGKLKASQGLRRYHDVQGRGAVAQQRAILEKWLMRAVLASLLVLAVFFPRMVLLGYVLPVVVMGPVVNTLRIVLEHADANPHNPYHWSTWYRTGLISRVLFFWDSGDCHVVHHIFPRLPFYRMSRAVALIEPVLLAQGVPQRHSYWQLLKGWLIDGHPHRSVWPVQEVKTAPVSAKS